MQGRIQNLVQGAIASAADKRVDPLALVIAQGIANQSLDIAGLIGHADGDIVAHGPDGLHRTADIVAAGGLAIEDQAQMVLFQLRLLVPAAFLHEQGKLPSGMAADHNPGPGYGSLKAGLVSPNGAFEQNAGKVQSFR